jgi:hypothetical protein
VTLYETGRATTSAAGHLTKDIDGHRVDSHSPIDYTISRKRKALTILEHIQRTHYVSQVVANKLIKSYDSNIFK